MRPMKFYACYEDGFVFAIHEGTAAARRACGGRRHYKAFVSRMDAEEWASWWNYRDSPVSTKEQSAFLSRRLL